MEQIPRSGPRVSEDSVLWPAQIPRNGWKIVAPHAKNISNPDQFPSGLWPGGL
jgi:hypothetical protein